MKEKMVIFTRTYNLLTGLLPQTEKFPKAQRFVVTKRLQDAALDFQEGLIEANALGNPDERLKKLAESDAVLRKLRLYLRLAHQWRWLSTGQYEHVSKLVAEIGNLLGGWIRATHRRAKGEAPQNRKDSGGASLLSSPEPP